MKTFVLYVTEENAFMFWKIFCLCSPKNACMHVLHVCVYVCCLLGCVVYISVHREMACVCLHVNKNVCTVHTKHCCNRFGINVILVEKISTHTRMYARCSVHTCVPEFCYVWMYASMCLPHIHWCWLVNRNISRNWKGVILLHDCACMLFVVRL